MVFNLDSIIFLSFILINIAVGLFYSKGVKNIKEYAVGNGNFSTMTIAATLVATWISGAEFVNYLAESYDHGLYYIWAALGDIIFLLILGCIYGPRMGEFIGKLSIADAMGSLYGNKVKFITALVGCIGSAGFIAVQLKVAGELLQYSFNIPSFYGVIISGITIGTYASLGGIRSVTFTDVIQLFTFGTIIPTLAFFIFASLDSVDLLTNNLQNNILFDFKSVFDFSQPKAFEYFLLFIFLSLPGFSPSMFQRVLMAKDTKQISRSFMIAAATCLFITLTMSVIGVLLQTAKPNMDSQGILNFVLSEYSYIGLKGLTLSGIMAMVMSTADSYINTTAVLFVHDLCKPLAAKNNKKELALTRLASFIITFLAMLLSTINANLLEILLFTMSFYMPIVAMPFTMAIFGFRTSSKSVLISMAAGLSSTITLKLIYQYNSLISGLTSVLVSLVFLIASHYFLKQPGGWIGIKDNTSLNLHRQERGAKIKRFINNFSNFNLIEFFKKSTSVQDSSFVTVSLFCVITIYMNIFSLDKNIAIKYKELIDYIYPSMLFLATALFSYPIWPLSFKNSNLRVFIWNFVIFYILICCSFIFVIISGFAAIQTTVFMINLIIMSVLLRWQLVVVMITSGIILTKYILNLYLSAHLLNYPNLDFKTGYFLLATSSIIVTFLKPKQDKLDLANKAQEYIEEQLRCKNNELLKSLKAKNLFLNNINHEIRTSVMGITNVGKSLYDIYDTYPEEKFYKAVKTIAESSERFESFMNNILDLAKLMSLDFKLNKVYTNFSHLIYDRVEFYKIFFKETHDQEIEFFLLIEKNVFVTCDPGYIKSVLDNLIINAIKYSKEAKIIIKLTTEKSQINFSIEDEGIGIPEEEWENIFNPFVTSSRTTSLAGGRGVGLALCKKAIELHGGKIWVESIIDSTGSTSGSTFFFNLPIL